MKKLLTLLALGFLFILILPTYTLAYVWKSCLVTMHTIKNHFTFVAYADLNKNEISAPNHNKNLSGNKAPT